eukprot:746799-Alexandrium_andersonii.AAC.1
MAYDPAIEGVAEGTGTANPTYDDDLASELQGAAQALAAALLLVAAGHAAGLQVDTHQCTAALVDAPARAVRCALRAFPVEVEPAQQDGAQSRARGLPVPVVEAA